MWGLSRTLVCVSLSLLLWSSTAAQSEEGWCSVDGPVGAQHPVQGLLETFEAGPGCAARERGNKETHVVAVGRVTNSPENKVTVMLRPLSPSPSPLRALHLLLSSKLPVSWRLEAERLPPDLPVLVQVSPNSSVESPALRLHVVRVHMLPFRPRALHRWTLKHHGNLSSLTHTTHGNRVYIRLGEDPTLPAVCQLQSMFLSPNYLTSDLRTQEVQGCSPAAGITPEVHVIKLHSAGSGLCGSLQVEVIVSLVPPVANSKPQGVVLILSSSVPVNWAIAAHGVRGHISVHSSNTVSPPYPPEPDLALTTTLNSDLSTVSDLLVWASDSGYTRVTSYTEADLANRFVIQLAGGGTDLRAVMDPLVVRPVWSEQDELQRWLMSGGGAGGGRGSVTVQCEDGRLSVTLDQHILQTLSVPVAAVTLQDPACQAQSNGSHFLLAFPVISCGTEALLLGQPRGVQYKNMMLLWRDKPETVLTGLNETQRTSRSPLGLHFSCLAGVPSTSGPAADRVDGAGARAPGGSGGPGADPRLSRLPTPRRRSGPVLILKLYASEKYEERPIGPCVITAGHRVYVEVSSKGPLPDGVEVKSCVVSPLSDPKKSPFWTVIRDGCPSDPSLTLSAHTRRQEAAEGDGEQEEEKEEKGKGDMNRRDGGMEESERKGREAAVRTEKEEETRLLRFSFTLRPVYNDSMQFLHCSLVLCGSDPSRGQPVKETVKTDCPGAVSIPPLVSHTSPTRQCEVRNLLRPMVVTQSISSLAPKPPRPSVSPLTRSEPTHSGSAVGTGPVMGIVFAAFVMGVSLMGALWCIYNYTVPHPTLLGGEGHTADQSHEGHITWSPPSLSDQSFTSV